MEGIKSLTYFLVNKNNTTILLVFESVLKGLEELEDNKNSVWEQNLVEKWAHKVLSVETVKLCSLLSVLLNHKDNKKGQQHTF